MHWLLAPANARITFFSKIGGRKLLPTPHPRLSQRLCPWIPGGFRGVHQGSPEQTLGIYPSLQGARLPPLPIKATPQGRGRCCQYGPRSPRKLGRALCPGSYPKLRSLLFTGSILKGTNWRIDSRSRAQAGSPQSRVTRGLLGFTCGCRKGPRTPGQERAGQSWHRRLGEPFLGEWRGWPAGGCPRAPKPQPKGADWPRPQERRRLKQWFNSCNQVRLPSYESSDQHGRPQVNGMGLLP